MPIRPWRLWTPATAMLPFSLQPERVKPWLMPEPPSAGKWDYDQRAARA